MSISSRQQYKLKSCFFFTPKKYGEANVNQSFFLTQFDPNKRHPNLKHNNFLPNKPQANAHQQIKLQIPNKKDNTSIVKSC